jgi:hypothetical protein
LKVKGLDLFHLKFRHIKEKLVMVAMVAVISTGTDGDDKFIRVP